MKVISKRLVFYEGLYYPVMSHAPSKRLVSIETKTDGVKTLSLDKTEIVNLIIYFLSFFESILKVNLPIIILHNDTQYSLSTIYLSKDEVLVGYSYGIRGSLSNDSFHYLLKAKGKNERAARKELKAILQENNFI